MRAACCATAATAAARPMEADDLRALLRDAIEQHIDPHELHVMQQAEASERRTLMVMAREAIH